jgi:hypothetical protein
MWNKMSLSSPENSDLQDVFLSKTNSIHTWKQMLEAATANIDCFLSRDTCVSSTQLNRSIWNKERLSLP